MNAPTSALPTLPRPPANAAPPMITAAIESSSASSPAVGEPESMQPCGEQAADTGREAAQRIDGDEHAPDGDAGAAGCVGIPADARRASVPTRFASSRAARAARAPATTKNEYGSQSIVPPPSVSTPAACRDRRRRAQTTSASPRDDAEARERDDERMRHAADDVDEPLHEADGQPGRQHREDHEHASSRRARRRSRPTTPESATVAPTERSMPRLTMTSSCPSARTAMTAVCEKTFPRFLLVKKIGVVRLTDRDEDASGSARARSATRRARAAAADSGRRASGVSRAALPDRRRHGHARLYLFSSS